MPPAGTAEGAVVALTSFLKEDRVHTALDAAAGYLLKDLDRHLLDRLRGNCDSREHRWWPAAPSRDDRLQRHLEDRHHPQPTGDYGKALRTLRS